MLISFGNSAIELNRWPEKNRLLEDLTCCTRGIVLFGEAAECPRAFYSLKFYSDRLDADSFGVGILSEGHGLEPELLVRKEEQDILVGFNSQIVVLEFTTGQLKQVIDLGYLFYRTIVIDEAHRIIVQHEIGVVVLDDRLNKVWGFDQDVITSLRIENGLLLLGFMDSPGVTLELANGTILRGSR